MDSPIKDAILQESITLDEHQFRMMVVGSLAKLEALANSTDVSVGRLSASVADNEERITAVAASLLQHQAECPMTREIDRIRSAVTTHVLDCPIRARVDKLEQVAVAEDARSKTGRDYLKAIAPGLWALLGALVGLLLAHGKDALRIHP